MLLTLLAQCATMRPMKPKKSEEVKARVDEVTKRLLTELALKRHLDISDVLREAIRDLLSRQTQVSTGSYGQA